MTDFNSPIVRTIRNIGVALSRLGFARIFNVWAWSNGTTNIFIGYNPDSPTRVTVKMENEPANLEDVVLVEFSEHDAEHNAQRTTELLGLVKFYMQNPIQQTAKEELAVTE
jgi:hypothetical protein